MTVCVACDLAACVVMDCVNVTCRIVFVGVNGYKCTATTIIMLDFRYAVKSVIVLSAFVACEASMDEKSGCDFPSGQRIRFFV